LTCLNGPAGQVQHSFLGTDAQKARRPQKGRRGKGDSMVTAPNLMSQNITELQDLFAASSADESVLMQIEDELRYRQAPRALALLVEVQRALRGRRRLGGAAAGPSRLVPVQRGEPFSAQARNRRGNEA
jgi:hypothetical protein